MQRQGIKSIDRKPSWTFSVSVMKMEIVCSPKLADKFITFQTELRLYEVEEFKDGSSNPNAVRLSDTLIAQLLSVNNESQYLKCVSWCLKPGYEHLLAVGQANGRVVLTSFNQQDNAGLVNREFATRHPRQCNAVAWQTGGDMSLLAAGLDKYRSDNSLCVWDINKTGSLPSDMDRRSTGSVIDLAFLAHKPTSEYCLSEVVSSLHWFNHQPSTLIAGVNNKHLKIFDIREIARHPLVTPTKAVNGVVVDPFNNHRVASYFENVVVIWDTRNFEKPVISLMDSRATVKIAWSPTRPNLLATLSRDSTGIKLYDFQHTGDGNDEIEPTVIERSLQMNGQQALSSFCWNPFRENSVMTVTDSENIRSHIICERITLNWSPSSKLIWSQGRKILQYIDQLDMPGNLLNDISVKMRRRAVQGYGTELYQFQKNAELVKDEDQLRNLWQWLDLMDRLREEGKIRSPLARGLPCNVGVHTLIRGETSFGGGTSNRSEPILQSWIGYPGNAGVKVYKSADRERALLLCSWGSDKDSSNAGVNILLDRLIAQGRFQRAAAVAVFNTCIVTAIQFLRDGATQTTGDTTLNVVAMALSGYSDERPSLWREMCDQLRPQLQNPYLKAMFAFLTCDNDSYEDVLNEKAVALQDRVAFACMFLPDNKLADYLDRLTKHMIDNGNLDGLLLTGLSYEGVELLQRYVDITGDIQTASLIIVQALPCEIGSDSRVKQWIESYRDLLDQWRLWHQRAQFDVNWRRADSTWKPPQQVFISCNYCGKSISSLMHAMGRGKQFSKLGGTSNKSKIMCCPGCRKPLPRCALCLIHMGTPSGTLSIKSPDEKLDDFRDHKLSTFSSWFTWCQSCRHGGHANHIAAWFKENVECPVTGCTCKCMSLDAFTRMESGSVLFPARAIS